MEDPLFDAYLRVRGRIADLVREADDEVPVPACPGWSAHDLVAHLVGLALDVVREDAEAYAAPEWTARQVDAGRAVTIDDLLAAWAGALPALEVAPLPPIGRVFGSIGRMVFVDAAVHEHDLRGALDAPDPGDEAVLLGLEVGVDLLGRVLRRPQQAGDVPALEVVATGAGSWRLDAGCGADAPVARVEAPPFELWRGLTGRRTEAQVAALDWAGDPAPLLPHWAFGALSYAALPLAY